MSKNKKSLQEIASDFRSGRVVSTDKELDRLRDHLMGLSESLSVHGERYSLAINDVNSEFVRVTRMIQARNE